MKFGTIHLQFSTGESTGDGPGPRSRSTWWPQMRPPHSDRGFWGGPTNETTPHRGFWGGPTKATIPQRGFVGGVAWPHRTVPALETGFQLKKKIGRLSQFFSVFSKGEGKDHGKGSDVPCGNKEVLDVERKWPYLPITPTQCALTLMCPDVCCVEWVSFALVTSYTVIQSWWSQETHSVGYVLGRVPKVACILSCLSGCNFTVIPYCWYLIGTCDLVSSNMITHFCWGEYLPHCGKTWSILSHLSGLIWSRNQRSTG
jgi:hypothetical protein